MSPARTAYTQCCVGLQCIVGVIAVSCICSCMPNFIGVEIRNNHCLCCIRCKGDARVMHVPVLTVCFLLCIVFAVVSPSHLS